MNKRHFNVHELKTHPDVFQDVWDERKPFEIRYNDRDFRVGDILRLKEWLPDTLSFSGRIADRKVTYILQGAEAEKFGCKKNYCIMAIEKP